MKILFCGGGTAGHVTPNLALIDVLHAQHKQHKLFYIGTGGLERALVEPYLNSGAVENFFAIDAHKLKRSLSPSNLLLPIRLLKSICQAKGYLKAIQPDVVFSKGGYVSLPVVVACKKLNVPCIIHESDLTSGLANKLCAKYATHFLSAFDTIDGATPVGMITPIDNVQTDDLRSPHNTPTQRATQTSSQKEKCKRQGLQEMGFDGTKPVLLVTGGSLGATALNNAVANTPSLAQHFDVFVLTGKGKSIDCSFVHQAEYSTNMRNLMLAADVCLTRGGSTTLAELTIANTPFVAVPLAKATRGEQGKNAQYFAQKGCGLVLEETLLPQKLLSAVMTAYKNRRDIQKNQQKLAPKLLGTQKTLDIILSFDKKQKAYPLEHDAVC